MQETHDLFGGELHVYKRENSKRWQCATFLNGRNYRESTKTDSLDQAKDFAEDWYLRLRGQSAAGLLEERKKGRPTRNQERSSIAPGSPPKNTKGFTSPPANERESRRSVVGKERAKISTTTFCSWLTPACDQTKAAVCSTATSRSSKI
jgi:hypothetical protein